MSDWHSSMTETYNSWLKAKDNPTLAATSYSFNDGATVSALLRPDALWHFVAVIEHFTNADETFTPPEVWPRLLNFLQLACIPNPACIHKQPLGNESLGLYMSLIAFKFWKEILPKCLHQCLALMSWKESLWQVEVVLRSK
jgi:hypothetical protein